MAISLSQSRMLIEGALAKGRALDLKPLSVVVLDPRIVSKPYGRSFIAALPEVEVVGR